MKIALAQLNPVIGDLAGNLKDIATAARQAKAAGARLVVTPELSICGYPPQDLLLHADFAERCLEAAQSLAQEVTRDGLALLVGLPLRNLEHPDKPLFNGALLLDGGTVAGRIEKFLLPTYDVFDERRWFAAGQGAARCLTLDGQKLGVHICEDAWNDGTFWRGRSRGLYGKGGLYGRDPVAELVADGAEVLINLSASPWSRGHDAFRRELFGHMAKTYGRPVYVCNQWGANDDLIFDGGSLVLTDGHSLQAAQFAADLVLPDSPPISPLGPQQQVACALECGVRDYVRKTGHRRVVIGLSGGIDSALVTVIACRALGPQNVWCVGMPTQYSSEGSVQDAQALCANLGCHYSLAPVQDVVDSFHQTLEATDGEGLPWPRAGNDLTEENLQPRIRGTYLMALSNRYGHLVLAPGNKSELAVGYSTLYGDTAGCLEVIGDLYKTEVYELCRHYNLQAGYDLIPQAILDKSPSAELRPNQKDADSLPDYAVLDAILRCYVDQARSAAEIVAAGFDEALVAKVLRLCDVAEFKRRQSPPVLRISARAFGRGRTLPIVQRFRG